MGLLHGARATQDYPLAQGLWRSPTVWEIQVVIPYPHQAKGEIEPGSPTVR